MDDLPTIALDNILSRFPIQHLMQYRSVCKSWLRLIDDPYFRKTLHSLEPVMAFGCTCSDDEAGPTIYKVTRKGEEMRAVRIASFPELGLFHHPYPDKLRSCNGFILLERWDLFCLVEIAIVNPLTKEIVRVPGSPYHPVKFHLLSLGFDPTTSTYKLVQVLVQDHQDRSAAAVYDLRSGSWRCCDASSAGFINNIHSEIYDGLYVSGTLNWVYDVTGNLVTFDLGREKFSQVHIPVDLRNINARVELMDMKGSLALCDLSIGKFVEIWLLQETTTHHWIRKLSIDLDGPVTWMDNIFRVYCYQDRVVFWKHSGEMVVERNRNGRMKISRLGRRGSHFIHHHLNNKIPSFDAKDELPLDLHVYSAQLNFDRLQFSSLSFGRGVHYLQNCFGQRVGGG